MSTEYNKTRLLVYTSLFTALTIIGAFFRFSVSAIPFSFQTFFVLLSGNMLGPVYGAASQVLYLILGLIGLPIFTQGGGIGYILQPSFGYLLGFPLASFLAGRLVKRHARTALDFPVMSFSRHFFLNAVALMALFIPGVTYLWFNINYVIGTDMSLAHALYTGMIVFLPFDVVKLICISVLYQMISKRMAAA